jgi:hypothetical protein
MEPRSSSRLSPHAGETSSRLSVARFRIRISSRSESGDEGERVDPSDVADELRAVWGRYAVRDLLVSEHDWSWVMLELADEGLPITKVPLSPQRLASQWQAFYDAVLERRVTHDPEPALARHVANLGLISGPSGLRPDLDVAEGVLRNPVCTREPSGSRASTQGDEPSTRRPKGATMRSIR